MFNQKSFQNETQRLHRKMTWLFCISMFCLLIVNAQPLLCKEDSHCSEGYYCDTQTNACHECLRCQDIKREPPKPDISIVCITTINRCGRCMKGFINVYRSGIKGRCVRPELLEFASGTEYIYVCSAAAAIGLVIVATFVYVIKHTQVFRVVAYYQPMSRNTPALDIPVSTLLSSQYVMK